MTGGVADPYRGTQGRELFAILGERWNYGILREVFYGVRRFGALQRALGIAPNILTARLAALVDLGLLVKRQYRPDKPWYEYHLSESARTIMPAWVTIAQWAEAHLPDGDRTPRGIKHTGCGQITQPLLACSACGEPMDALDVAPVIGDRPDEPDTDKHHEQ
ncbi:winged helix-turn-helix transcriptional regulator [Saccharopolyspora phatthalungensis]|uniref:DNA-binding HxlR family transcriptional regulator n=1 Tax=Saccharopolyspora phatthalungensis TaxID=664693 RepID=A0A840Q9H5_9PSEU|nr:helix-turn-helix domain-containing protein [Saccharopolyspora phatthalungensis]MBB5156490.1 DNA-binding HxlR family transcriptional regulator [Saccharopolyspora phatthalungensis]